MASETAKIMRAEEVTKKKNQINAAHTLKIQEKNVEKRTYFHKKLRNENA